MANFDTYSLATVLNLLDTVLMDDKSQAADEDRIQQVTYGLLLSFLTGAAGANAEVLAATKELADTDSWVQALDPDGGDYDVEMPPEGANNHPFAIINTGASGTLVPKDDSGATAIGSAVAAGEAILIWPDDGNGWYPIGGGSGNSGGLTYNAVTVTGGNVAAVSGNHYDCTIAGLTAERDFSLPTPAAAGELISLRVLDGDADYELVIKANGTEITRLFIAGEYMSFMSTGTGAGDWQVLHDGRIACVSHLQRTGSDGNTAHAATTFIKADWNALALDVGEMGDLTNDQVVVRRAGNYVVSGAYSPAAAVADQKFMVVGIYKNTTQVAAGGLRQSAPTSSSYTLAGAFPTTVPCAVGDALIFYFQTEETNRGLGRSDRTDALTGQSHFLVREIF